jgi:hypothetical protein
MGYLFVTFWKINLKTHQNYKFSENSPEKNNKKIAYFQHIYEVLGYRNFFCVTFS